MQKAPAVRDYLRHVKAELQTGDRWDFLGNYLARIHVGSVWESREGKKILAFKIGHWIDTDEIAANYMIDLISGWGEFQAYEKDWMARRNLKKYHASIRPASGSLEEAQAAFQARKDRYMRYGSGEGTATFKVLIDDFILPVGYTPTSGGFDVLIGAAAPWAIAKMIVAQKTVPYDFVGPLEPGTVRLPAPAGRTPFPAQLQPVRDTINQVLKGQKPLSALTAEQRRIAAEFYRKISGEVGGKYEDQARQFNLERARFLEQGGDVPPGSLPEFMQRPQ